MLWINQQSYVDYLVGKGNDPAYMKVMIDTAQAWVLPAMASGTAIAAGLGAFMGAKLLKKQFERAGII